MVGCRSRRLALRSVCAASHLAHLRIKLVKMHDSLTGFFHSRTRSVLSAAVAHISRVAVLSQSRGLPLSRGCRARREAVEHHHNRNAHARGGGGADLRGAARGGERYERTRASGTVIRSSERATRTAVPHERKTRSGWKVPAGPRLVHPKRRLGGHLREGPTCVEAERDESRVWEERWEEGSVCPWRRNHVESLR